MSTENEPLLSKDDLEKKYKEEKEKIDIILKEDKYDEAYKGYNDLIMNIEKDIRKNTSLQKEDIDEIKKIYLIPCYSNLSYINIKQKKWKSVIENANTILEIDKKNTKALYRKCYAEINLSEYENAEETLYQLKNLIGDSPEFENLKKSFEEKKTSDKLQEMKKYRKMMNYYHKLNEEKEYKEISKIGKFFYGCHSCLKKILCCCNKRKTIKRLY